jgi:hypothetical protein
MAAIYSPDHSQHPKGFELNKSDSMQGNLGIDPATQDEHDFLILQRIRFNGFNRFCDRPVAHMSEVEK